MRRQGIHVLCIQEIHILRTPYYITDDGYLVVLSGSALGSREFAGVGFIIAPAARDSVIGFLQRSNRLACIKLRVEKGRAAIISAYAPHSGHSFDSRQSFFSDLQDIVTKTSVNGMKCIFGDFNARPGHAMPGEEAMIGDHTFGNHSAHTELGSNRALLLEFCEAHSLAIGNTFLQLCP